MVDRADVDADVVRAALDFVQALRAAGVAVSLDRSLSFVAALDQFEVLSADDVYWAGRATLLARPEDTAVYDEAFTRYFTSGDQPSERGRLRISRTVEVGFDDPIVGDGDGSDDPGTIERLDDAEPSRPDHIVRYAATDALRQRDFGELTDAELVELWAVLARLRVGGARRRSAGTVARSRGHRFDLRRTAQAAARRGGEIVELRRRDHDHRLRPLVLLIDVSGSMEPYARAMLRFAHAALLARTRVEVFTMGTRLTRLTRELHTTDADRALRVAGDTVPDWSGGTRLGRGLRTFLDEWGQRGTARGATVVILSDGWDRGEPEELAEQMSRLGRLAHRVVWVNPLKASPGYAPLARGMAAALPYCDSFVEGHSLGSLEALADLVTA